MGNLFLRTRCSTGGSGRHKTRGLVTIGISNSVVKPIILISLLSVVVLITKKSEKVIILERVVEAENRRQRAPDVGGVKSEETTYIA